MNARRLAELFRQRAQLDLEIAAALEEEPAPPARVRAVRRRPDGYDVAEISTIDQHRATQALRERGLMTKRKA